MPRTLSESPRLVIKGTAIRTVCRDLGDISRDELSRQMGFSTMTAYRIDAGKTEPSPRFIAALIDISGKRFDELFDIVKDAAA